MEREIMNASSMSDMTVQMNMNVSAMFTIAKGMSCISSECGPVITEMDIV